MAHQWISSSKFYPDYDRTVLLKVKTSNGIVIVKGRKKREPGWYESLEPGKITGWVYGVIEWKYIDE